ncbi:hypothetical protein H5V45_18440 [Nocardioides sp. KIGAM211]|uniref:DUF4352 domain-containing protein n=1 Tax=Nocardioides luti TaxID=2761101 RepID=A0A7X0RJI9_9ACTN|nr:hypothetical protein [Nocardioides luti]MBB6629312.1 hypothetical protein [Nocardioides luti]
MRWLMGVLAATVMLSGCSQISAQMSGEQASTATESSSFDPDAGPILVTQQWGVVDGMLSVVVRNTSQRTLRFANAVITARDEQDVIVASSAVVTDGTCCDVVDLPAGEKFGFYFDVGSSADAIAKLDVAYQDVAWATASGKPDATFTAKPTGIDKNSVGAVVVADVVTTGARTPQVSAQAFLNDKDGKFIAVVSGRWDCFVPGTRQIRMQLFHPVPPGTVVEAIRVHPVEHDPARPSPDCSYRNES